MGGLALAGTGLMMACTKMFAQDSGNAAVDALQLALTLEYLEDEFYQRALNCKSLQDGRRKAALM